MSQYALRVPDSLMARAKRVAEDEHTSLNQLFVTAIAEKLASLDTEDLLGKRAARADAAAFRRILARVPSRPVEHEGDRVEGEPRP
jgi:hypothetical protein